MDLAIFKTAVTINMLCVGYSVFCQPIDLPNDGEIWTQSTAVLWSGQTNATLPCTSQGEPKAVRWMKGEDPSRATSLVLWGKYFYGEYGGSSRDGSFSFGPQLSLVIHQVQSSDEGRYICQISHAFNYWPRDSYNYTDVMVRDLTTEAVYTLSTSTALKDHTVYLPCDFLATPLRVSWRKVLADGTSVTVMENVNGSFEVFGGSRLEWHNNFGLQLQNVEVSDEGTYWCTVLTTDGTVIENSTVLTVNALAPEPFIRIKQCYLNPYNGDCEHTLTATQVKFELQCAVYQAKPAVSVYWTKNISDGTPMNDTELVTTQGEDGTFDTTATLKMMTSLIKNEENFTCVASGIALGTTSFLLGTVNRIIFINIDPPPKSVPSTTIIVSVLIAWIVLCILIGVALVFCVRGRRHGAGASLNAARDKINRYRPGQFADTGGKTDHINIALLGLAGAGKSSLVSSISFALKGQYHYAENLYSARERLLPSSFGEPLKVTDHIHMYDIRGLGACSDDIIADALELIGGGTQRSSKDTEKIHCAVYVCRVDNASLEAAADCLAKFSQSLKDSLGGHPMVVITFKRALERGSVADVNLDKDTKVGGDDGRAEYINLKDMTEKATKARKQELNTRTGIPVEDIWILENYTGENHVEDEERSKEFLDLLSKCLEKAETNLHLDVGK